LPLVDPSACAINAPPAFDAERTVRDEVDRSLVVNVTFTTDRALGNDDDEPTFAQRSPMTLPRTVHLSTRPGAPSPEVLAAIRERYERGRIIEALELAQAFAPLSAWRGVDPCVLAARLAANAGGQRLAMALGMRALREDRRSPAALAQTGYDILSRRGPIVLWERLRGWREGPDDRAADVAELVGLQARAAIFVRDFTLAEKLLARAESLDPKRAWIQLQRSFLLEAQDRIEEALEVAEAARTLHPHAHYRPGVQTCASLLQLLDRDDAAIRLLTEANAAMQSGPVAAQLYAMLSENGRWPEAERSLEQYVAMSPLREASQEKWVATQRARTSYHLGRRSDAAAFASQVNDDFYRRFAAKLAEPPASPERIELDVTFVRQHFKTCAPATLASLGEFWKLPAEHLKVAEAVCYDGTPISQQRNWAEENGWHVREFRLTYPAAIELLERRIPFAISVVNATSAHMMAVIGFDQTRSTLLFRDPSQPYVIESEASSFLKRYRAFGPLAVVFIPSSEASRLDGVDLPDAELYDHHHRLSLALSRYDRGGAAAGLAALEAAASDDAVTWVARLELATYDGNVAEQLRCIDKLLEMAPDDPARLLQRFACMRDAPRDERIAFITEAGARKGADPALLIAWARALQGDARRHVDARKLIKRAIRQLPFDTGAIVALADLFWESGDRDDATDLYRFAANLDGFREQHYQAWFSACRGTRRTQEAIEHLQDRFARFGSKSEQPALTLAWAWKEIDRPEQARDVLDAALGKRPGDGYLRLRAASLLASLGAREAAEASLESARGNVRVNDWLRARLEIAENDFAFDAALATARTLLDSEPLALDAHAALTRSLARREGSKAALASLRSTCEKFPQHCGLQRMLVEWSSGEGPRAAIDAARALLALEPSDVWARRELALALVQVDENDDALSEALEATRISPNASYSYSVLGMVYRRAGRVAEARASFERAIKLGVDNGDAITSLLGLARSDDERRADLELVERELVRQVVLGDGLLAYLDLAGPILDAESLLTVLRTAHAQRPDLWHAWSALAIQLGRMQRLDEALAIAQETTKRFGHVPRTWLDLALVHRWRKESDEEIRAAERAFEINPLWNPGTLALTAALEGCGRMDDAQLVYERALKHSPHDAQLRVHHASLLWRLRRETDAFASLESALRVAPANDWAWTLLRDWAHQSGGAHREPAFARALAAERPGEFGVWLALARSLTEPTQRNEQLEALERALELDSRSTDAWDLKAEVLALDEKFDEALRACDEGIKTCVNELHNLHGRRAWIEARRGRMDEAIGSLRAVLATNGSYAWGWYQLATWLLARGELSEATAAFDELRRLRPHDSFVHRQLAHLYLQQKDRARAKASFEAALAVLPTDAAAAHGLFEAQLDDADVAGACATLQAMQTHQPGAATLAAEVVLWARQGRDPEALEVLEKLCASPDPAPWPLAAATDACIRAGFGRLAHKVMKRAVRRGAANPETAAAMIQILLSEEQWLAAARLFRRLAPGEAQKRAAPRLFQGLGDRRRRLAISWALWGRADSLRADDNAWGQVGYALYQLKRIKKVVAWLGDWQQRPNLAPWMLFNYCLALRNLGRYAAATEVADYVVRTWGHRDGASDMRLFLAVEAAIAGAEADAREHLRLGAPRPGVVYDRQLTALTEALIAFRENAGAKRAAQFAEITKRLSPHFAPTDILFSMRDARRTFGRAGEAIVSEGGGLRAWLWFKWKLHWQWSLIPLVPIVGVAAMQSASMFPVIALAGAMFFRWAARPR
jgi:cellulose synthase operon protein C